MAILRHGPNTKHVICGATPGHFLVKNRSNLATLLHGRYGHLSDAVSRLKLGPFEPKQWEMRRKAPC
ncbi:MAG: hypothetical protein EBY32_03230 [Proteobacteria bacterium]|nr:hypothetical protein [Pseudomonadota bacterium]